MYENYLHTVQYTNIDVLVGLEPTTAVLEKEGAVSVSDSAAA